MQVVHSDNVCSAGSGSVERFIAVPVSPSYLTDHLRALAPPPSLPLPAPPAPPTGVPLPAPPPTDCHYDVPPPPVQCTALVSAEVGIVARSSLQSS